MTMNNRIGVLVAAAMLMGFFGGFVVSMLAAPPVVQIDARGLDVVSQLALFLLLSFGALVLACSTFSRHVEAWLASWREGKRGFADARQAAAMAERTRLQL